MQKLRKRIMWRVYLLYVARRLRTPLLLKCYGMAAVFVGLASLVSVGNVLLNMPKLVEVGKFSSFSLNALWSTELQVQALVLAMLALGVWMVRDIFVHSHRYRYARLVATARYQ